MISVHIRIFVREGSNKWNFNLGERRNKWRFCKSKSCPSGRRNKGKGTTQDLLSNQTLITVNFLARLDLPSSQTLITINFLTSYLGSILHIILLNTNFLFPFIVTTNQENITTTTTTEQWVSQEPLRRLEHKF